MRDGVSILLWGWSHDLAARGHLLVPGDLDGHVRGQDEAWRAGKDQVSSSALVCFDALGEADAKDRGGGNIFIMTKKAETRSPGRSAKRLRAASEGVNLKNVIFF